MKLKLRRNQSPLKTPRRRVNWRLWYYLTIAVSFSGFIWTALYIYRNLEASLSSTADILLLKPQIASESFDPESFQRVLERYDAKLNPTSTPDWANLNNPFRSALRGANRTSPAGEADIVN